MADYARQHDFSTKSGTTIFGSEVDDEFDTLVTVIAGKVDESREAAANGIATLGAGALIPVGISGDATSGGGQIPEATATALGAVELATAAEATSLSDASRAITPSTLNSVIEAMPGTLLSEAAGVLSVNSAHLIDLDALGAVSAADRFMVSTGAGAWGYETASQVRTTLGLDTNDTPTLGGVTLGSAVLTGPSANRLEVGGRVAFIHDNTSYTSAEIFFSTSAPTTEGNSGDIYFEYTA